MTVPVAIGGVANYTGGMPKSRYSNPDEIGFMDAMEFLGVSESTMLRLIKSGKVRRYPRAFSKRPYYLKSELQALLDEEQERVSRRESPES